MKQLSCFRVMGLGILTVLTLQVFAATSDKDPHYTEAGFFDIHVCNWPDQPLFLMALFSTKHFNDIARIELLTPNGSTMGLFDPKRYRVVDEPGKEEKRVLIAHFGIPNENPEGWYSARITMKDGRKFEARDHVLRKLLPFASNPQPPAGAENIPMPTELRWDPVPGAAFYQVYLRDEWESERYLLKTKIIKDNFFKLPPGLLKPGGSYTWRIHARNIDGDPEWGDFNHGSLAKEISFTIAD
ncbi:MAG: fibronectin type III domain-containing protein [Sulfuritalea sp.]|nr:fibronectin type III domain-containing protein [Sulfuritalea sp.]